MLIWIPTILVAWLTVGAIVAVPFLALAVGRVVEGARGSSLAFRLLVLPGAILLWPVILRRWIAGDRGASR
jgi:hypothetical protein